jgi:hypothetical protein
MSRRKSKKISEQRKQKRQTSQCRKAVQTETEYDNKPKTMSTIASHSNHALIAFRSRIFVTLQPGAVEFVASLNIPFSGAIMRN